MKPVPLDVFLTQMAAMLDGQIGAAEVEAVVGPSPSGTARLGLYTTLVERQQRAVIDEFYRAARVAAETIGKGRFTRLREAYLREHPPSHWVPTRAAAQFGAFLEGQGAPLEVIELVDFAWIRHQVLHADNLATRLAVRHYTHQVREFSSQVESEGKSRGRPVKTPQTCLVACALGTAALIVIEPSIAALVVLQVLEDKCWTSELPDVPRHLLLNEAENLAELGVIASDQLVQLPGLLS